LNFEKNLIISMDEYLLKLDTIIRQTTMISSSSDMFVNEIAAETIKEISQDLKVFIQLILKKYWI